MLLGPHDASSKEINEAVLGTSLLTVPRHRRMIGSFVMGAVVEDILREVSNARQNKQNAQAVVKWVTGPNVATIEEVAQSAG